MKNNIILIIKGEKMNKDYTLHIVESEADIDLFWQYRNKYMLEDIIPNLSEPMSEEGHNWFFSKEYKDTIMEAFYRETAILRIVFFQRNGQNIGFAVYVIYHSEEGKCLVVEFCINDEYRNKGIGTYFFKLLRKHTTKQGAKYYSLNVSNEKNKRFWEKIGFKEAGKDEYGDKVYEYR